MATLTVRLDDRDRDDLEQLAKSRGVTLSELVRRTLLQLVGRDVEAPRHVPPSLDIAQRHTFRLLHELMGSVGPESERDYHRRQAEVLEQGYTVEYESVFGGIVPEMTSTDATLVFDILDMFAVLESGLDRLDEDARASLGEDADFLLRFQGFDYNHSYEYRLLTFAKHLIADGKWASLAHHFDDRHAEHEGGNSHMPMLHSYRRLLAAYTTVLKQRKSSTKSIIEAVRFDAEALRAVITATVDVADADWHGERG